MRTVLLAVLALVLGACVTKGRFEAMEAEAGKFRTSLADESARREALEKKAAEQEARIDALAHENRGLRSELEARGADLGKLDEELKLARARGAELEASLQQTKHELEAKSSEYSQLEQSLKGEIEKGQIELTELRGRMTVKLKDRILFRSGSAVISGEGRATLAKVADAFKDLKGRIVRVEGHTDDVPIATATFPSNWELSGARALAVVRFLQQQGVDPGALAGAAYSEYRPVAANDTPEGRSQNRRIEIVLAAAE